MINRAASRSRLDAFRQELLEAERRGSAPHDFLEQAAALAASMPLDMFEEALDLSNRALSLPARKDVK